MPLSETDRAHCDNLCSLIQSQDRSQIEQALELLRTLESPALDEAVTRVLTQTIEAMLRSRTDVQARAGASLVGTLDARLGGILELIAVPIIEARLKQKSIDSVVVGTEMLALARPREMLAGWWASCFVEPGVVASRPPFMQQVKPMCQERLFAAMLDALPDVELAGVHELRYCAAMRGQGMVTSPPRAICRMTALKRLDMSGCKGVLPDWIGEVSSLEELVLSHTRTTALPDSLRQLTRLRVLAADRCERLLTISDVIGSLTALEVLDLGGSSITTLPDVFDALPRLHAISLKGNLLTTLPPTLSALPALTFLDLTGSVRLTRLPASIWNRPGLTLRTDHCPNLQPPPSMRASQ